MHRIPVITQGTPYQVRPIIFIGFMLTHLHLANALLCLLLAAQFVTMPALRPAPKRLLALNFFLYAHQSLILILVLNMHIGAWAYLRPAVAMCLGPCLYLYFACVKRVNCRWKTSEVIHPALGLAIFACLLLLKPQWIDMAILASFVTYFLLISYVLHSLYRGSSNLSHLGDYAASAMRWLQSLMAMTLINIVLEIAVDLEMQNGTSLRDSRAMLIAGLAFLSLNSLTILGALYRSTWLEWMYQLGSQNLPKPAPALSTDVAENLFQRWETLLKTEELHKQEFGITLALAARKLQVPARQLSNAINQVVGKSFSAHLNGLRLQEAQQLLINRPEMSIIDIMVEAGFSSKSNFNKEFLRETGMSPSAFRESKLNPQDTH
ncbi:MAG: helix-turn-helix domain-containing protein [Undibacterium sp.]|nr:helix-turn-helix domain-containing protein [Undibacterium sp.]